MSIITESCNETHEIVCYSAWSKNDVTRLNSSSGGVFYEFAKKVIDEDGVAIGAAFENDGTVSLCHAESLDKLYKLMGSKYVQSNTNGIFELVKTYIKTGKMLVFCSTPCQCNALIKYLKGIHPANLLIIDFICHGVPSEYSWIKYLEYRANGKKYSNLSFRDKRISWKNYGTRIAFEDGTEYFNCHRNDSYMKIYLANRMLRPSCYKCRTKGKDRCADITLGDFWGIKGGSADKGSSVMLINSSLGAEWFGKVEDNLITNAITYKEALKNNGNYFQSCGIPFNRNRVIEELNHNSTLVFDYPEKYIKSTFVEKVIRKGIRIVNNYRQKMGNLTTYKYLNEHHQFHNVSFKIKASCCGCGACKAICPTRAITFELDNEGFRYPVIAEEKCCHCNLCKTVCPFG